MHETLSGNTFAQLRYVELVSNRKPVNDLECVKDFCTCDCPQCVDKRNDYRQFLDETNAT